MSPTLAVSGYTIRTGVRDRRAIAVVLLALGASITIGMAAGTPAEPAGSIAPALTGIADVSAWLMPVLALLLSHQSIAAEAERGGMALLLSHAVTRRQVIFGTFLGHLAVVALAAFLVHGFAGPVVQALHGASGSRGTFALPFIASVLLGAGFLSIGYLAASLCRERAAAAGAALGVWLVFTVLYDLAVQRVTAAGPGVEPPLLHAILLFNPADVHRLVSMAIDPGVRMLAWLVDPADAGSLPAPVLFAVQLLWVVVPFSLAMIAFQHREA